MGFGIPIYWRYLLKQWLRVFTLCTLAFIAVVMTTRLEDIVNFASLGPDGLTVVKFILLQIPYVLPIVIPISCLIATILLIQNLSRSHELTAFRAAGFSLKYFLAPILILSAFVAFGNFVIVSELATSSHLATNQIKTQLRAVNPLHLVRNKHLLKMKGIYYDAMGNTKIGENASDVVMAIPTHDNKSIQLVLAENLKVNHEHFTANRLTMISPIGEVESNEFDRVAVENIGKANSEVGDFMTLLQKHSWKLNHDYLRLPLLLGRIDELRQTPDSKRDLQRALTEIMRRISLGLAPFTFTLIGAAFGISIGRNWSNRGVIFVTVLAAFYLACYFLATGINHLHTTATILYLAPHLVLILAAFWMMRRITVGVES